MLTRNEIVYAVNLALEATEASRVGAVYGTNEAGDQVFNTLALNTYYHVLGKLLPAAVQGSFDCTEHRTEEPAAAGGGTSG